jgi:hypothetical protein
MSDRVPHFLDGGGKAAAEILAFDWSNSPLGCLEEWPASLKTAVGMMLASLFPKAIFWGPQHIMLHNDAFRVIMGAKPAAIGHPMREIWSEIWDEIRPIAESAMQGEATFLEDMPLTIERGPHPELCYFTFCYSPIRDENGRVAGFIDTVIETTGKVEGKQALQTQNAELAHRIGEIGGLIEPVVPVKTAVSRRKRVPVLIAQQAGNLGQGFFRIYPAKSGPFRTGRLVRSSVYLSFLHSHLHLFASQSIRQTMTPPFSYGQVKPVIPGLSKTTQLTPNCSFSRLKSSAWKSFHPSRAFIWSDHTLNTLEPPSTPIFRADTESATTATSFM